MWNNLNSNLNSSFQLIQERLLNQNQSLEPADDEARAQEESLAEVNARQIERLTLDRDHFRALATQLTISQLESRESTIEATVGNKSSLKQSSHREPGDGSERDVRLDDTNSNQREERLKEHLIQIEEQYTQELLEAREREELLENEVKRLRQELEKSRDSSTQLRKLSEERDRARTELSRLEDRLATHVTSIQNLQLVIEQIQKENERKVSRVRSELEQQLELERGRTRQARDQLVLQEERVASTVEALGAASRISESLDAKEALVVGLRAEVGEKAQKLEKLETQLEEMNCTRVDKQVIKGLVLGLFVQKQREEDVKRLLARTLDFNEEEMQRSGIELFGKSKKQTKEDSFGSKFVLFLENESKVIQSSREKRNSISLNLAQSLVQSSIEESHAQKH